MENRRLHPVYAPSVTQITEDELVAGQMQSMASLQAELSAGLGAGSSDVLSQELDPENEAGILSQMPLSFVQRIYLRPVEDLIKKLDSILPDIGQPSDSIIASIGYGLSLPGLVIGSLSKAMERCAVAAIIATGSPLSFVNTFRSSVDSLTSGYSMLGSYIKNCRSPGCGCDHSPVIPGRRRQPGKTGKNRIDASLGVKMAN